METMMYNLEFKKQAEKAIRIIAANAPYIYDENCGRTRMSRRIEGFWTTSGDRQGHRNVFCYVERGLEKRLDPIASFFVLLMRYQQLHGYSGSRVILAGFGGENDDIKGCPVALRTSSIENAGPLAKMLCTCSDGEQLDENAPSVFKAFFPRIAINYTNIGGPTPEDIVVIFKTSRLMLMSRRARNSYLNRLRRHTAWVTIGEDGFFSIEVGTYVPEEWMEPEGSSKKTSDKKQLGLCYGL